MPTAPMMKVATRTISADPVTTNVLTIIDCPIVGIFKSRDECSSRRNFGPTDAKIALLVWFASRHQ